MSVEAGVIRAERHLSLGAVILRDAFAIIDRWSRRAVAEQPKSARLHHRALLDDLPALLEGLGQVLQESSPADEHCRPARRHGKQRWETGWSLSEVVQDYQILRLVLVEYLEDALRRPLRSREAMAIGLALDEAIAASVTAYSRESELRIAAGQEQLLTKTRELEQANRRKDEFLATLGHELRNPLAPLTNVLSILKLQSGPDVLNWAQDVMERQLHQMRRLIDDLLDTSRIAQGKVVLQRAEFDLARATREWCEDRRSVAVAAGLDLTLEIPGEPVLIHADRDRVGQILTNLLQNAIKFSNPCGHVRVRLHHGDGLAIVEVEDDGIGIMPELLSSIFDPFIQGAAGLENGRSGLGLGLGLVRGLAELHGGSVRAASDGPGQGAHFVVSLPLRGQPS